MSVVHKVALSLLCFSKHAVMFQVRFFEVSEAELERQRSAFSNGQLEIRIEEDNFSMKWVVYTPIACQHAVGDVYTHCCY